MKDFFHSKRYAFQAEIYLKDISHFTIYGKHLKTSAVSPITNVNCIISSFSSILVDKDEVSDINWGSTWEIKDRILAEKLWEEVIKFFQEDDFIRYLEYELDDDRDFGGWNSAYKF